VPDTEIFTKIDCPVLVIHGTEDRIQPYRVGEEATRLSQGTLVSMAGSGHMPNVRDPVKVNLVLRDFVERLGR
jgi:pimeloyl-ACP methyl ester carboxylesterase